jgi:hypothetical protein
MSRPFVTFLNKLDDHQASVFRDCVFNTLTATLHIWRPASRPQPEDAPCHGDRDPYNMESTRVNPNFPDLPPGERTANGTAAVV